MSDSLITSAVADGRVSDGGKAMQAAFVRVLASLATATTIFAVTLLIWSQSDRAAGRIIIGAQKADGYLPMLVSQFAAVQGRTNGH